MKRVKAACITQTLHFLLKEDVGYVVYRALAEAPANIYSLLLVSGYFKTPKKELQADGAYLCEVSIPNREIASVYKSEILSQLMQIGAITRTTANMATESLYVNDIKKLCNSSAIQLETVLKHSFELWQSAIYRKDIKNCLVSKLPHSILYLFGAWMNCYKITKSNFRVYGQIHKLL